MKTTIITTLLAVGMLFRPQSVPTTNNGAIPDNPIAISATQQATPQVLKTVEMNSAVGSGISGCYQQIAENGDRYTTCCVDFWIFAICISVNVSAIERLIPFL
ncbi:MAG: hypothetical protein HW389_872 [Bacteroidetes bacterium]|jgi:hypothetical protein|nr:hypothetical protein [Bacteroidota bacterium]